MKEAIFTLGLPGAGKSTVIKQVVNKRPFVLVSADIIRERHSSYDPKHPEIIHEDCVGIAEHQMYLYAKAEEKLIVMDGGGINNSYTLRIISKMKESGYKITVVFVNTPTHICVSRNLERMTKGERFVPIEAILDKAYLLPSCEIKLREIADEFIEISHFTDDVFFVDLDGTVAAYQRLIKDVNGNIDFVNYDIFKYSKPVWEVINKLRILDSRGERICILSASPNSLCNNSKREWIKKYMPFIKEEDIYFCGNKDFKYVMVQQLIKKMKLQPHQITIIDDDHKVLESYESLNINALHPSAFLTLY